MKTAAIIAEYNPFHNGHLYQLHKVKELTDADYVISIMSGNFLQRGVPAMWDKYTRAKMTISAGIDMVLELPTVYATGSAYDFAMGAIMMLNKLNVVDYLCFGAETDDLDSMLSIAQLLVNEPAAYKESLQNALSCGNSYPAAREHAVSEYLMGSKNNSINLENAKAILSLPNNTLALEYICALLRTKSPIKPILIKRVTSNYHDDNLQANQSSANAIRNALLSSDDLSSCIDQMPKTSSSIIKECYNITSPVTVDQITELLQGLRLSSVEASTICDFDNDLADRFNKLPLQLTYEEILQALSTKNKTTGRAARALIHYLLGYTTSDRSRFQTDGFVFYASLLAFRKNASELIKSINSKGFIKIITKKADYKACMPENYTATASLMWQYDIKACELYNTLVYNKYKVMLPNDYKQSPVII